MPSQGREIEFRSLDYVLDVFSLQVLQRILHRRILCFYENRIETRGPSFRLVAEDDYVKEWL